MTWLLIDGRIAQAQCNTANIVPYAYTAIESNTIKMQCTRQACESQPSVLDTESQRWAALEWHRLRIEIETAWKVQLHNSF